MSDEQDGVGRRFSPQQKVAILREHLVEKVPVSEVSDKHGLNLTATIPGRLGLGVLTAAECGT